jgi:hypothetical protein
MHVPDRRALALILCGFAFSAVAAPPAPASHDAWEPKHTWVFAVGLVRWKDKQSFDAFPKKGRLEPQLVDTFKSRGVPADHISYLQDEQATQAHIEHAFHDLLARTAREDMLVVYFQGHGYWDQKSGQHYFACFDCDDHHTWAVNAIFDFIEREFRGGKALLIGDCCGSGGLCSAAAKRKDAGARVSYACLASSFRNNSSTGAWTFTASVIKGLRGDPVVDLNGDGTIELDELIRYAEAEMAFIEAQRAVFAVTGSFDKHMSLEHASGKRDPDAGRHVEAKWDDGRWWKAETLGGAPKDGKVHVRYVDDDSTGWVKPTDVRTWKPPHHEVGTHVVARVDDDDDKRWHPGTVIRAFEGLDEVHFDDSKHFADEWVSPDRVKVK